MRTLVDIPDDDIRWLDRRAGDLGISRTALVREAVLRLREGRRSREITDYFGIWRDRTDIPDGLTFQHNVRSGTSR